MNRRWSSLRFFADKRELKAICHTKTSFDAAIYGTTADKKAAYDQSLNR